MTDTVQLRRVQQRATNEEIVDRLNDVIDLGLGNRGGRWRLRSYSGAVVNIAGGAAISSGNYPLDIQGVPATSGKAIAVLHSATTSDAVPTAANSVLLVDDNGIATGFGKSFRIYETAGTDYTELTSADGMLLVGGSGADAGSLTLSGSNRRIVADMTTNRLFFQTNVADGYTYPYLLPKGTSQISGLGAYNGTDIANAGFMDILITSVEARLLSSKAGTGAYVPLSFYTGGSRRLQIDTSGNILLLGTVASTGLIRWPNATAMYARNQGNSGDIQMIGTDASDQIGLGQTGNNLLLLGTVIVPSTDPPIIDTQVTAGSQCKAFAYVTGGGGATLGQNYNIASVTRNGAGDFTVTIDRDFAAATYAVVATVQDNGANLICRVNGQAVGSFDIHFRDLLGTLTDPDAFAASCFGTLS